MDLMRKKCLVIGGGDGGEMTRDVKIGNDQMVKQVNKWVIELNLL